MQVLHTHEAVSNITKYRLGLASLNISDQKAIFDGLPPEIRSALWKDRLAHTINTLNNQQQIEALTRIQANICPDLYQEGVATQDDRVLLLVDLANKAMNFRQDSINNLFTMLGDDNQAPVLTTAPGKSENGEKGGKQVTCNCSTRFNCFLRGNDCGALSKACINDGCVPTRFFGCGTLWLFPCDGTCCY